ncbi:MAG: cytochrome c oxidase accessory protein CcoG, partial [Sulfurimonas sp.]
TYAVKSRDPNNTVGKFSLSLSPDKIRKRVLVVSTDSKSYSSSQADTVVKLDLIIYAKEDPKISVKREISFMYPRAQ